MTALEKEQMFVDILPDGPADDGIAYLKLFCGGKRGRQSGSGRGADHDRSCTCGCEARSWKTYASLWISAKASIVVDETEDIDWINNWKQYFHQFYVDDILIIPSWEEVKTGGSGQDDYSY